MQRHKTYIESLILQGEGQHLDFKYNISDSRKIARSLVAFSNSDGGTLLIGVKDNGNIAGIRTDEELFMLEAAANTFARPEIITSHEVWEIDNKTILEVTVKQGSQKPYMAVDENGKWRAYIRAFDQNILACNILIKYWKRLANPDGTFIKYSNKEKILLDFLQNNRKISFAKACNLLKVPDYIAENIIVNLMSINLLKFQVIDGKYYYFLAE